MPPREDTRSLSTVIMHTFFLFFTTVLSLTGNLLVCIAFCRNRRLRTITNFYVFSLSLTGIIISTFSYPFITVASGLRSWPFGFHFCQLNGFLYYYFTGVSIGILALTAINRYFCVVKHQFYPILFTRKKAIVSIIFVWTFPLTAGIIAILLTPILFHWHPHYLFCEVKHIEILEEKALTSAVVTVFIGLPMCLILLCYGNVYRAIRQHNSSIVLSLQEANDEGSVSVHEIQASRVLLAAVIAFCVCWIPTAAVIILEKVAYLIVPSFWQSFSVLFSYSSAWINPIIYGVMNRAMRKEFIKLLRYTKETLVIPF